MSNPIQVFEIEYEGKKIKYWFNADDMRAMRSFQERQEKAFGEWLFGGKLRESISEESFYFVILRNSKGEQATGKKSRTTGRIFLLSDTDPYEIDIRRPIEDTDYEFERDARGMDI